MVYQVAQTVKVPVIGMGGICNAEDALEFILAGATAVSIGTANFHNPYATVETCLLYTSSSAGLMPAPPPTLYSGRGAPCVIPAFCAPRP